MRKKVFTLNLEKHYSPEEYINAIGAHPSLQSKHGQVMAKYVFAPGYTVLTRGYSKLVVF